MTTRFDRDTALHPIGDGVYEGRIDPAWRIIRGANGGHLAAIVLRGMLLTVADEGRPPRALTVYFASVPREAPVDIRATVERSGRSVSFVSGRMEQEGKLIATGLAAFSTAWPSPEFADLSMPEVPSPEDVEQIADRTDFPFGQHFDIRRVLGAAEPSPDAPAETGVWMRLREPQTADHIVVTQYMDAWAPAVFNKLATGGGGAGVPTIEMTCYFREPLPLPGAEPDDWYLAVFRTTTAREGFIEEDGWLWSRDGRLVAQSRQLALLMV